MQSENVGLSALGSIGEKAPVAPDAEQTDKYRTPSNVGPSLSRVSLGLARASASQGASSAPGSPGGPLKPSLARVSAQQYPNLSRASQINSKPNLARGSVAKAQQELSRRSAIPTSVSMTLSITDTADGSCVAYKQDGLRFQHSKYTVKFLQGHTYSFSLTVGSDMVLSENFALLTYQNESGAIVKDALTFEPNGKALAAEWTCSGVASGKGKRNLMELTADLEAFGKCEVPLCAKVYSGNETKHASSGLKLKSIIVEFRKTADVVKLRTEQWVTV